MTERATARPVGEGSVASRDAPWLDRRRYPFDDRWLDLPAGPVHCVDEGTGPAIVLLHGNPTWSFLYRHLIDGLSDEYRCVAPDLPGFGLSAKAPTFSYRPAALAGTFDRVVDRLGFDEFALVVHDWGGPIGLDYATRNPADVSGIVAMNTWCWPRERAFDGLSSAATHTSVAEWLYQRYNVFARAAIAPLVASALAGGRFERAVALRRHYLSPLASAEARRATWTLSGAVGRPSEWLDAVWKRRDALRETPIRLLWGGRDPVHGSFVRKWRAAFPDARATVFDGVGHFVPEQRGSALVEPVRSFAAER